MRCRRECVRVRAAEADDSGTRCRRGGRCGGGVEPARQSTVTAEHPRGPIIPHADFGGRECCGCLFGLVRGDEAEIRCDECDALICTPDLQRTLTEMELRGDVARRDLSYSGAVHLSPGCSRVIAFVCDGCGKALTKMPG